MEKLHCKLLALSTPRSGTRFVNLLLRSCGVKIGHEAFKRDGTVGMFFAVEDVSYPGKHWSTEDESRQRRSDYQFEQVWHFVRDPRKAIPSIASHFLHQSIWWWQERHTGISAGLYPKALRAMLFWVAWHELIEKNEKVDYFFRVEDIDVEWPVMCRRMEIPEREMPAVERDLGTVETGPRRTMPLSFDEMDAIDPSAARAVRDMAERYGYE